jgi:glutaminyl-peptide cyclotransferase
MRPECTEKISSRQMRPSILRLVLFILLFAGATGFGQASRHHSDKSVPEYTFEIVRQFPHDANAFTQGFAYRDGYFYEGTGLKGHSSLRQVRIATGEVIRKVDLPLEYFGEGIALLGNEAVELTWQSHIGFAYDLGDFHRLRSFSYPGEGWGITEDGHNFFLSDGTAEIRILDGGTFAEKRRLRVHDGSKAIDQLNELEFVEGEIYANIWHQDRIARISPQTGEVVGWIDMKGLLSSIYQLQPEAVLNGIAYDREYKRLFVTGKLWPKIFEIRVVPKSMKQP